MIAKHIYGLVLFVSIPGRGVNIGLRLTPHMKAPTGLSQPARRFPGLALLANVGLPQEEVPLSPIAYLVLMGSPSPLTPFVGGPRVSVSVMCPKFRYDRQGRYLSRCAAKCNLSIAYLSANFNRLMCNIDNFIGIYNEIIGFLSLVSHPGYPYVSLTTKINNRSNRVLSLAV